MSTMHNAVDSITYCYSSESCPTVDRLNHVLIEEPNLIIN